MPKMTTEEKAQRARDRMIEKAKEYKVTTYVRKFVSPIFQRMIRAEFGADRTAFVPAVVEGSIEDVPRRVGQCACVTCGKVERWDSGIKGMHTGHFLASRRNSILFEETNVAPQCQNCNFFLSGAPRAFRIWMLHVRGEDIVTHLEQLKTQSVSFTRPELVDMRLDYTERLQAAEEKMKHGEMSTKG